MEGFWARMRAGHVKPRGRRREVKPLASRMCPAILVVLVTLLALSSPLYAEESATRRYPTYVTPFDLATRDDLLFGRLVEKLVVGDDPAEWGILSGVAERLGTWLSDYISAQRIADVITSGMPIEGQPPIRPLDDMVADCARVLHVEKPLVYVRNSPFTTAYATEFSGRGVIVLTSGLVRLYDQHPEELRFVVGHELGHLKCGHVRTKTAAYGILSAVQSINPAVVPDEYQVVLPTLALGRLFTWSREAEISADRAGLVCCQDANVASQALLRLQHGLGGNESILEGEGFDPGEVVKQFEQWQSRPFVEFVVKLKETSLEHPFIPERLAALKAWAETGACEQILARTKSPNEQLLIVFNELGVGPVGAEDATVHPYVVAYEGHEALFATTTVKNSLRPKWTNLQCVRRCTAGQPVYFEIFDDGWTTDTVIGGFVVYPTKGQTVYSVPILWDWKESTSVSRQGLAEVRVEFRERTTAEKSQEVTP